MTAYVSIKINYLTGWDAFPPWKVVAKLLTPLGKTAHNSPKYFATVDIIKVAQDSDWLWCARARSAHPFGASCVSPTSSSHSEVSIATRQISRYWQSRN